MKYFFQLGSNKTLSIAEIMAVFADINKNVKVTATGVLLMETDHGIEADVMIEKMGGTVKIGVIESETKNISTKNIVKLASRMIETGEGKFKFGISYYGRDKLNLKTVGMELKKYLREKAVSCRWVTSRDEVLSSVVVEQNKLTTRGIEIVLMKEGNKMYVGRTLSVQPFKKLSKRDYGRPARDDESGMLPPKLAQIMINLARKKSSEAVLLDPFCGSGTVLSEAMLLGYKKIYGSDKSAKAISDSRENLEWLYKNNSIKMPALELSQLSATALTEKIGKASIDLIVTEPYLGPQRGRVDFNEVKKELEELYSQALKEFAVVLKEDGRVVMIFPVFLNKIFLQPRMDDFEIVKVIDEDLLEETSSSWSKRNTVIYGREGQRVWRELMVLRKSSGK